MSGETPLPEEDRISEGATVTEGTPVSGGGGKILGETPITLEHIDSEGARITEGPTITRGPMFQRGRRSSRGAPGTS